MTNKFIDIKTRSTVRIVNEAIEHLRTLEDIHTDLLHGLYKASSNSVDDQEAIEEAETYAERLRNSIVEMTDLAKALHNNFPHLK